ncbi:hypothetical protein [Nostoc sp. ChiQUE01b]|uniref:hypothetical protein n=1 Tax=Nostoc sp. ChiQUE01b TaxID=3075376 RepID=UPI002AD59CDD|nr:hypothetical protein [Nostoc sp. ChiQUE01b]
MSAKLPLIPSEPQRANATLCLPSPQAYRVYTNIGRKGFNSLVPDKSRNIGQLETPFIPLILELGRRNQVSGRISRLVYTP